MATETSGPVRGPAAATAFGGDPVARARALHDLVQGAADEAERERRLPARVAEAMAKAGLYRVSAPAALSGGERDPATQIRTIEAISEADGSAGWNLMIGIETLGLMAVGFPRAAELFADPTVIVSSSTATVGRAERVPGGYRVTGRWPFVSGCHNSHFFGGVVAPHADGEPVSGEPGRFAVVSRDQIEIMDTWRVGGLCGSGSHDVQLNDVFVPEHDTFAFLGSRVRPPRSSALARIPMGPRLAYNKVGVALGIARAAIDSFVDLANGKIPRFSSSKLRERADAQHAVARAEARLRGARAFVMEVVGELWDIALAGDPFPLPKRAILQIACSDAVLACAEAVDTIAQAAGTSANPLGSPLERRARDVRVVRQHVTVAPQHIDDAGRVLLGLEPQGLMLAILR